jgi:heat shock protein HslJ
MRNVARRLLFVSLIVSLAACGQRTLPAEPGGPSSSYDGTWILVEGHGPQGDVPIVGGYRITLTIDGESISGTAACNSYDGEAAIDDTSFELSGAGMTEMGCKPNVTESQDRYMTALLAADKVALNGDTLTVSGKDTELLFEVLPPIPTAELIDTNWELETLLYGTGPEGMAASARPANLLLKSDGTLKGTTGCRDLYGDWKQDGDEIAFTTFGAEGNCPKELRDQDGLVVTVLGDGFTASIEEDRLTAIGQGDQGLVYRKSK